MIVIAINEPTSQMLVPAIIWNTSISDRRIRARLRTGLRNHCTALDNAQTIAITIIASASCGSSFQNRYQYSDS